MMIHLNTTLAAALLSFTLAGPLRGGASEAAPGIDEAAMATLGWTVAVQSYTFRKLTLFETIDTLKTLGVHHVELWLGQPISKDLPIKTGPGMPAHAVTQLKAKFASSRITPVACGVIRRFPANETEARALFAWAKDVGIITINAEPKPTDPAQLDLISRLCDEYQINVGIHNHANPSTYWNPKTVLEVVTGRSLRFGACGDTGHWSESGLIPTNCLKQLAGHVKSLHLRNVATDQRLADMFVELKNQNFHGVISYEGGGNKAQQNVADFVRALNATAVSK